MIYTVYGYNTEATYFDEINNLNAKAEAEALLLQRQQEVLAQETSRFSICATFVSGNDTIWREVQDTDPEDTICQVFDTLTGTYTQVSTKSEAFALNEQKKLAFLTLARLDKVYELSEMPKKINPIYGAITGEIPVESM